MSSVNAPQPEGVGPAEVFDSTAAAPHGPTISAVGNPAGPPQETPAHTGMMNTFDMKLHQQFVPIDTVTWSVTMTSGTLMWKKPIHPQFAHNGISYLAGLYNAWSGSMDYNFKVAGTGFHAGAIAIVRIPPNRKPEDFNTSSAWGLFEYVVIDPKTLEVESLGVSDQRPIAYHYMKYDEDTPNTFGGWIAMYCLLPLNTSATGSQQISIQVFNRPGMTFQFSQLIMPTSTVTSLPFPVCYQDKFDFSHTNLLSTYPINANALILEPDKITTTMAVLNCYTLDGKLLSKYNKDDDWISGDPRSVLACNGISVSEGVTSVMFLDVRKPLGVPVLKSAMTIIQTEGDEIYQWKKDELTECEYGQFEKSFEITWNCKVFKGASNNVFANVLVQEPVMPAKWSDNTYAAVAKGESIVHFGYRATDVTKGNVWGVQVSGLTDLFRTGVLADYLPSGQCFLFLLVDKSEGLPVAYMKLYKEGFFTTRAPSAQTIFSLANMKLVFDSYVMRAEPIPVNNAYNVNRLLLGTVLEKDSVSAKALKRRSKQ